MFRISEKERVQGTLFSATMCRYGHVAVRACKRLREGNCTLDMMLELVQGFVSQLYEAIIMDRVFIIVVLFLSLFFFINHYLK